MSEGRFQLSPAPVASLEATKSCCESGNYIMFELLQLQMWPFTDLNICIDIDI